jgi:transposase-like protein
MVALETVPKLTNKASRPEIKLTLWEKEMKGRVNYSEAFRRGVVEQVEGGRHKSLSEASRRNGIRGKDTLVNWIRKYGREDMLPKRVKVETVKAIDELQAAKGRIRELEGALADAHRDWCLESAFLAIACERPGTTVEELKKKNAVRLADARKRREVR